MNSRISTFGCAKMNFGSDALDRQCGFFSQASCNHQLIRVALASRRQIRLCPTEPTQFFTHNSIRPGKRGFQMKSPGMVLAELSVYSLKQFAPKIFAAEQPAAPKHFERFLIGLFDPSRFHPPLKFLPACGRVLRDAVFTQQAINPNPFWPVFRRSRIPTKAAPGIS